MPKSGKIDSQTPVSANQNAPHPSPDQPGVLPGVAAPGAMPDSTPGNAAAQIPGFAHIGLP
jgi:hypothetical protein